MAQGAVRQTRSWTVPVRLAAFYGAVFLLLGVQLPYWPVWLTARGLGAEEIGYLLGVGLWVKVFASPLIASRADRAGRGAGLMIFLACAALASYAAFFLAEGFWPLLIVTIAVAVSFAPLMPLGEALTLAASERRGFQYGRVRLWGSLTFIAGAVGGGWLLADRTEAWILWMIIGSAVLVLLASLGVRTVPVATPAPRIPGLPHPIRRLATSRRFLLFVLAAALIQSAHAVYYGFATLHWRAAGLAPDVIGWLWAEGVLAEIILFALGGRLLGRFGPRRLLLLAGAAGVVRWTGTGLGTDLGLLIAMQSLHAFTFGAAHLGAMAYIARQVAPEVSATAQSLYSALVMGAGMGLVMPISGVLFAAYSGHAFIAMAVLCGLGAVAAWALSRHPGGRRIGV